MDRDFKIHRLANEDWEQTKNDYIFSNSPRASTCCARHRLLDDQPKSLCAFAGTNVIATRLPKMNKPTIIFGADVTHAATDDETAPSIAAVVATYALERKHNPTHSSIAGCSRCAPSSTSVDQYASRYESCFSVQGNRVEMLTTLKVGVVMSYIRCMRNILGCVILATIFLWGIVFQC